MSDDAAPAAAQPAPTPVPDATKVDAREQLFRELVQTLKAGQEVQAQHYLVHEQLLKEHTQVIAANTRSMELLRAAILGTAPTPENPDGEDGLIDAIDELHDVADPLGEAVTATNITLARYAYVFDVLTDINTGDPEAPELAFGKDPEPGVVYKEGRAPSLLDIVAALRRFDAESEAEAKKEEEERLKKEEQDKSPSPPAKPPMMGNSFKGKGAPPPPPPIFRALPAENPRLPPLPVAPPRPGEPVGKG